MMDMALIRPAVISALAGLGLNTSEALSGATSLPLAVVGNVESIEYSKSLGGTADVKVPLWVMVSRSDDAAAQRALDGFTSVGGPKSVYSALRTLNESEATKPWRSLTVLSTGPYGSTDFNTAPALAVAFNLSISA